MYKVIDKRDDMSKFLIIFDRGNSIIDMKRDLIADYFTDRKLAEGYAEKLNVAHRKMLEEKDLVICPRCGAKWDDDSEQAAAIRLYGFCIPCCVEREKIAGLNWSVDAIVAERIRHASGVRRADNERVW